jgi:hypothetical protein
MVDGLEITQEEINGHPEVEPGMLMLDIYPSGDSIVIRVYTRVREGEQPVILERLLAAQESRSYLSSVGSCFPKNMRMLLKLMVVASETTGVTCIKRIHRNKFRPNEYAIYFVV